MKITVDRKSGLAGLQNYRMQLADTTARNLTSLTTDLYHGVRDKTPVDTGRARAGWKMNYAMPSLFQRFLSGLRGLFGRGSKGSVPEILISNDVPYVPMLEFGLYSGNGPKTTSQGYSTQAPRGMVRVTMQELRVKYGRR